MDRELDTIYEYEIKKYKEVFIRCMDSYRLASSVGLGAFDNAYGNLDFLVGNKRIRQKAYDAIYNKLVDIVLQFRTEAYHFNLLKEGKGNLPACASKVVALNQKYFSSREEKTSGYTNTLVFQSIFDDIDASLEKFRCKIYGSKYTAPPREPVSGKMLYFDEDGK